MSCQIAVQPWSASVCRDKFGVGQAAVKSDSVVEVAARLRQLTLGVEAWVFPAVLFRSWYLLQAPYIW